MFDASANSIVLDYYVKAEEFYLITDVTTNTIIYNFSDPELGFTSVSFDEVTEKTTIVLTADCVALGCADADKLQIIVDVPSEIVDVHESFLDPVHKIRVSTPENLIDTDFEYGLQPTKWETLELSNNVPSFYVADGDATISSLTTVSCKAGSDLITVNTSQLHGLVIGTPIDVQGLTSRTAEGKYLIKSATDYSFTYQASSVQTRTGDIGSIYTTVIPGQFYAGSQITYDPQYGIQTDGAQNSEISIQTTNPHGFTSGSNFYLVNTVATKTLTVDQNTSSTAPDGRPYVDFENTVTVNPTVDLTKTETKNYRPPHSIKFDGTSVNTVNNTISWTNHKFRDNDCIIYVPPSGDTAIGGLNRFDFYYVIVFDANNIQLTQTRSGSAINFTSAGTYNYGRAMVGMVYEIARTHSDYRNDWAYGYTEAQQNGGVGSGWDMNYYDIDTGGYGLNSNANSASIEKMIIGITSTINYLAPHYKYYGTVYGTGENALFQFGETTTTPERYNFIEDDEYWTGTYYTNLDYAGRPYTGRYFRLRKYYWHNGSRRNWADREVFMIPLVQDDEADTLYSEGLSSTFADGDIITFSKSSGDDIKILTGGSAMTESTLTAGSYQIELVGNDRFRVLDSSQDQVRLRQAAGVYAWTGTVDNTLANTFYFADHGLTENIDLTTDASAGTLPTATTGTLEAVNGETNLYEFSVFKQAILDYQAANTGYLDIVTYSNLTNGYITNSVAAGRTENIDYISTTAIPNNFRTNIDGTSVRVSISPDEMSETSILYPYKDTRYDKYNMTVVGTTTSANSTIPFHMSMRKAEVSNDATWFRNEMWLYLRAYLQPEYSNQWHYQTYTPPTANNNYHWSCSWTRNYGGGNTDFVIMSYKIRNRSITDVNTWMRSFYYQTRDYAYVYNENPSYEGDIEGLIVFSMVDTMIWNQTEARDIMYAMIDAYDANMQYPALTDQTAYDTQVVTNDRIALKDKSTGLQVDVSSSGSATLKMVTEASVGIVDGAYQASVTGDNDLAFHTSFEVNNVNYLFDAATLTSDNELVISGGHQLKQGASITYDNNSNVDIGGLTSGSTYYVIIVDDVYIQLAASAADAESRTPISLTAVAGTHKIQSSSISGVAEAVGTVTTTEAGDIITGTETLFKRYFKVGDTVFIKNNDNTPGSMSEYTVRAIADDTSMQLDREVGFAATNTKHFVTTNLYARPDGYAIHRPFDGGVEIAAGTAPDSQIRRQTRKYFRYQSGKGIQTSLAINFNPPVTAKTLFGNGNIATLSTTYPHRLSTGMSVIVKNASDSAYNGEFTITKIDDFSFSYAIANPVTSAPNGIIKYNVNGYQGARTRAGMFDQQNGFFFEYDGQTLYCVRRSSTTQLGGTINVVKNSNKVTGVDTNFGGQINDGDYVVIRGQTYKVTKVASRTEMYIQPEYRGVNATNVVLTLTEDVKVPQEDWNLDVADGTGLEGFNLDINQIQMAYMDYSWYGAGKIRFGFKDRIGKVRYVHQFVHNNRLDEAYMRSGNICAAYEVINDDNPTYAPTLFHWGTSVIMDGTFDEDEAYLFTATSNSLSFTNGQTISATTTGNSDLRYYYNRQQRNYDIYVRIPFASSDASKLTTGSPMYSAGDELKGETIAFTQYSGSTIYAFTYITSGFGTPASYPIVPSGTAVTVGQEPGSTDETVNLGTDLIPLVTLRLAPSVDSGISGFLGERDIINRMQLRLQEVGLILTHECEVKLILNGDLSRVNWENVTTPSLSQLQKHVSAEKVTGGTEIFSFRAAGGSVDTNGKRLANSSNFSLEAIIDMGNSILGGDGTFPNGPDILTLAVQVVDTSEISATSPFSASGRITWSESQA